MQTFNISYESKEKERNKTNFLANFKKQLSSTNVNFLIGAGCTTPSISILGNKEEEINSETDENKKQQLINDFKKTIIAPHRNLGEGNTKKNIETYKQFLLFMNRFLSERDNNILPRKVNIFTTNYDLFIEESCKNINIVLNDGFDRRKPMLSNKFKYSRELFFNRMYTERDLYSYTHEIPIVNLIKLHGSLSWEKSKDENEDIIFKNNLNEDFLAIMPTNDKYSDTVLSRLFYDMLRFYSNELNKENTILISMGFSFNDKHILNITKRILLTNPTLILIIFCFDVKAKNSFEKIFSELPNVWLVHNGNEKFIFEKMINILNESINNNG